jgi:aminopeptidase N
MHAIAYDLDLAFDERALTASGSARMIHDGAVRVVPIDSPIAPTGTPLLRFVDPEDGAAYVYSLFVPAAASRLFPCIDRPDAKAVFTLRLALPPGWVAVSCGEGTRTGDAMAFAPTPLLPTYAFGLAAGPFEIIEDATGTLPMRAYVRRSRRAHLAANARTALRLSRAAVAWGETYFGMPFPYAKHDLVLIPGFPFGGMEHAGATFLDEAAIAIGNEAGEGARRRRAHLVFHETVHQWLGDCVTMRAFDDLWLKEGFANLGAALCGAAVDPTLQPWLGFHRLAQTALRQDLSAGAVPVRQTVASPEDAKALYGPAVYGKAPAVLRQARHLLGPARFDAGVRQLVTRHAFGNATLEDLGDCLDQTDAPAMRDWLREWLERPGAPTVRIELDTRDGRITDARVTQHDASGAGRRWTQRLTVIAMDTAGGVRTDDILLDADAVPLSAWRGAPTPHIAFANAGDHGYGRFELDERSREAALAGLGIVRDPMLRLQLVETLWNDVRDAALHPARFLAFALLHLERETEWAVAAALLEHGETAATRYLADVARAGTARPALTAARTRLGLVHRPPADPACEKLLALAGAADADAKARCFASLVKDADLPDRWVEAAAARFNAPTHAALTLPYLRPALDALPDLARLRGIFFTDRWLSAFCGGHASAVALATVHRYLAEARITPELRRKVLEHADELARAVQIRARYPGPTR